MGYKSLKYALVTKGYVLVTKGYVLVTKGYALVTKGYVLVTRLHVLGTAAGSCRYESSRYESPRIRLYASLRARAVGREIFRLVKIFT
jgi:hypothetical protein